MDRKFDLILFDLDGTVFDTAETIKNTLRATVDIAGLRKLSEEEINSFIGPPIVRSFKKFYPDLDDEAINELMKEYRAYYMSKELLKAKLFPGVLELIKTLRERGYKTALATYKLMKCVTPLFDHYDVTKYFDTLRGSVNETGLTKTDIMKLAIDDCKISDLNRVCMVGDTEHDLRGAIECGVSFIAVSYGMGIKDITLEEQKYSKFIATVDSATDILNYV